MGSIDNPSLANEWNYEKNDGLPKDYAPCSRSCVWWKCKKSHEWQAVISSRNGLRPSGCPMCTTHGYSKVQIEWLKSVMVHENITICHAENGGEYNISNVGRVDGYCEENNTVYEFHGDFYHGNPVKFQATDINPVTYKTYGELYEGTLERDKLITSLGYNLITMWEHDYLIIRKSLKTRNKIIQ